MVIVFTLMGFEHMGHEKMTVDILVNRFPRRLQNIVACFIYLIATAILVIAVWQLIRLGHEGAGPRSDDHGGAESAHLPLCLSGDLRHRHAGADLFDPFAARYR